MGEEWKKGEMDPLPSVWTMENWWWERKMKRKEKWWRTGGKKH